MAKRRKAKATQRSEQSAVASALSFQWCAIGLIVLATILVYGRTVSFEFTNWDDNVLLLENEAVRSLSPAGIVEIFTPKAGATYQPIRVLSYAINWAIHEDSPMGYHLINMILHGLGAVFLFLLLFDGLPRLLGPEQRHTGMVALIVALLFAVHPVNVESVAWVSSRKYGLLGSFYFSAWWLYVRGTAGESLDWRFLGGALACTLCAVLSSPFGVTLPAMIVMYDYCSRRELNPLPLAVERKLPYALFFFCAIGIVPLLMSLAPSKKQIVSHVIKENRAYTLLTMHRCVFDYGRNLAAPFWLNNRYPDRFVKTIGNPKVLIVLVGALALIGLVIINWRQKQMVPLFCFGWFMITWLPVSNIIAISTLMADRYMYLAAIGVFLGAALASSLLLKEARVLAAVWAVIVVAMASIGYQRTSVWQDSVALWKDSIAKDSGNYLAHNSLANAYTELRDWDLAMTHYKRALALNKDYHVVHFNLGQLYDDLQQYDDAIASYERFLVEIDKRDEDTNRVDAMMNLGVALGFQGEFGKALALLEDALAVDETSHRGHNNLANVLNLSGRDQEAKASYLRALELEPDFPEGHYNFASLYAKLKQTDLAVKHYRLALEQNPEYADAYNNLANILKDAGKLDESIAYYKKALGFYPDNAAIHNNIAVAYRKNGQSGPAKKHSDKAMALNPSNPVIYFRQGNDLVKAGKLDEALVAYQEAIGIDPYHATSLAQVGHIHRSRSEHEQAIAHYEKAVEYNPRLRTVQRYLAELLTPRNPERAIQVYRDYLDRHADDHNVRINLGALLFAQKRTGEAIVEYAMVLEEKPDFYEANLNIAVALQTSGQKEKAVAAYRTALKLKPEQTKVRTTLGALELELGQFEAAIKDLEPLARADRKVATFFGSQAKTRPKFAEALATAWGESSEANLLYVLGATLAQVGQVDAAIASHQRALTVDEKLLDSLQAIGSLQFRAGRSAEALKAFQQALAIGPATAEIHNNLASAYFSAQQPKKAIEHFELALKLDPNHKLARENLSRIRGAIEQP